MGIGSIIKEKLRERSMTIKELAALSGISVNTLYSITKRDSLRVESETLELIANALKVQPYELTPGYYDYVKHTAEMKQKRETLKALIAELYGERGTKALDYCGNLSDEGLAKWFTYADDLLAIKQYNQAALEYEVDTMKERPEYYGLTETDSEREV